LLEIPNGVVCQRQYRVRAFARFAGAEGEAHAEIRLPAIPQRS
jgi:hypothetical protein